MQSKLKYLKSHRSDKYARGKIKASRSNNFAGNGQTIKSFSLGHIKYCKIEAVILGRRSLKIYQIRIRIVKIVIEMIDRFS